MIEILSVLPNSNSYNGFIRKDGKYYQFTAKGEKIDYTQVSGEYRNYEHFIGVMAKFNPWFFFLKRPVMVEKLDADTLSALNIDGHSGSIQQEDLT